MSADGKVEIARLLAVREPESRAGVVVCRSTPKKASGGLNNRVVAETMERALFGGTLDDILNASDSTDLEGATRSDEGAAGPGR
jgi:hypothetical protein